jgi:hypothetical protein
MYSSASLKPEATNEVVWIVLAAAMGFLLAGLLQKSENPRPKLAQEKIEFTATEFYDR